MQVEIITIFPGFFESPLAASLLGKAGERGLVQVRCHDLRDWTHDRHRTVDDEPFGGGAGMVMSPGPWFEALDRLQAPHAGPPARTVLLAPDGARFDQATARRLATEQRLILCCGRYEGIDDRVRTRVDEVLSIGDYVLAGGETAALVVLDAVARLVPGVMGNAESATDESFSDGLLEYPQYTRPAVYRGLAVPEILRSGNHGAIERWRRDQALERTRLMRPELLDRPTPPPGRSDATRDVSPDADDGRDDGPDAAIDAGRDDGPDGGRDDERDAGCDTGADATVHPDRGKSS